MESRSGTRSSQTFMPPSPAEASSDVAHDSPAPPRSWMPATSSSAKISRVHSMSSFSMKGSPTCTLGRFAGPPLPPPSGPASKVSLASTETPPMPSPPVRAPYRMTRLPAPDALARWISSCRITPTQSALTSGLPAYDASNTASPPMFGSPRQLP